MIQSERPRVGVALSGGGFRAAAFHLGVLKRLEELGVLARIEALSTVSGGSITGALYALRCAQHGGAPGSYGVDALIDEMQPVLFDNLRARALFGTPRRAMRALQSMVSTRISRIGLMVEDLDRRLFQGATLNQLPPWIAINATNLRTGKGWRFMADRAGDYLAGATEHTKTIRIADAVAASAAYPGLTDSYAFETRWEHMRGDLLDERRWERPPAAQLGSVSRWRARYGAPEGPVRFPLVDGGLYDNEGINTLRGHKITHAIISGVAPPESDSPSGFGATRLLRVIEVVHGRLGAATRQLAHEMTHGVHPGTAAQRLKVLADSLRATANAPELPNAVRSVLADGADEAEAIAAVGMPPRGPQFTASAQVLLQRVDLADNAFASTERGGLDVPMEYRGLEAPLAAELSRVRTDLDALEPVVFDLLMAQGYFLTDFLVKLTMPELVFEDRTSRAWYATGVRPDWARAHAAVQAANANGAHSADLLRSAAHRVMPIGRVPNATALWVYWANFVLLAAPVAVVLLAIALWLLYGLWSAGAALWFAATKLI